MIQELEWREEDDVGGGEDIQCAVPHAKENHSVGNTQAGLF